MSYLRNQEEEELICLRYCSWKMAGLEFELGSS